MTGDEVKALLAEPGTASPRALRDTVLLTLAYDTAARVQELCDLDVRRDRRPIASATAQSAYSRCCSAASRKRSASARVKLRTLRSSVTRS